MKDIKKQLNQLRLNAIPNVIQNVEIMMQIFDSGCTIIKPIITVVYLRFYDGARWIQKAKAEINILIHFGYTCIAYDFVCNGKKDRNSIYRFNAYTSLS